MKPPAPGSKPAGRQLRFELPSTLNTIYSNAAIVSHTHSEIVLDLTQVLPNDPRARVQARVVMTPANAKLFLNALKENLERFENKHGEISLPPKPVSLAEQLFDTIKPTGEEDDDDDTQQEDDTNG